MSKTDLAFCLLRENTHQLSYKEKRSLEIMIYTRIYRELLEIFKSRKNRYYSLIKFDLKEKHMTPKLMQEIIMDIISTEEYSLAGISNHTRIPEDTLFDVAARISSDLTSEASRKVFELHISVRRDLPKKKGRVTVPHPKKSMGIKTIKSILKQAGLTPEEFRQCLK